MNDEILRRFNGDYHTKDALVEFFNLFIRDEIAKKVLAREDVSGYADAHEVILKGFDFIKERYAPPTQSKEETDQAS